MLVEYSKVYLSPQIHEIVGICLIVLVAMHLILNRKYIKAISKGRYSKKRSLELIINLGFFYSIHHDMYFWNPFKPGNTSIPQYWKPEHNISSQNPCIHLHNSFRHASWNNIEKNI